MCGRIAGALLVAIVAMPGPGRASARQWVKTVRILDISPARIDVAEAIESLRRDYHAPISFIDGGDGAQVSLHVQDRTTSGVLAQILRQNRAYRLAEVNGRWVVFPNRPGFQAVIEGVQIVDVPRLQAADRYIGYLKGHIAGFEDLVGTISKGNPEAPLFTTPVTLPRRATVLQHLVALLGDDPSIAFSIRQTRSGKYVFFLETVP